MFGKAKHRLLEVYRVMICLEHAKWKKVAALADGRIGWVPKIAREGDRVCVVSGERESFLLRKVDRDRGLLGDLSC